MMSLVRQGKGKDQRRNIHLKVLNCSSKVLAFGDAREKFDHRARAWLFSQLHRRNGLKFGRSLEETLVQQGLQQGLQNRTFWRAHSLGK